MMANLAIGIDLGTSTSEIAYYDGSGAQLISDPATKSPIIPSLVARNRKGELLVGELARRVVDIPGRGVREVKRLMGTDTKVTLDGREYRPEEISACILKRLKEIASEALGETVTEVVLSVPANFPDSARTATRNAAELAGLKVRRLINEPTAAALAYGIKNIGADEKILVFDWGGGTLDISILDMIEGVLDVKASYGDNQLGGKDFDEIMIKMILDKFRRDNYGVEIPEKSERNLKHPAEMAKIALSSQESYYVEIPNFTVKDGEPIDLSVEVTRYDFDRETRGLISRANSTLGEALRRKDIDRHSIDKILLVGGTTYMPCVRRLIKEFFGKDPKAEVDADRAVAMGACIQAAIITDMVPVDKGGIIVTDVSPYGLGVRLAEVVGGQFRPDCYDSLIEPNTSIPYSTKKRYALLHEDQDSVEIELFQDHRGGAKYINQTVATGKKGVIRNIEPSSIGRPHPVEVEFSYNQDGTIDLKATIPALRNKEVKVRFSSSGLVMGDAEKAISKEKLQSLWTPPPATQMGYASSGAASLVLKGELMLKKIDNPGDTQRLQARIEEVKTMMASGDHVRTERALDRLTDMLYELESQY